jgi:hypothetical protein
MKRALLMGASIAVIVGLPNTAFAQGPLISDWWGGSNFIVTPGPGGGSTALGFDAHRRSYWQTNVDTRGNSYGYDARGNYWTYNARTNTYQYFQIVPHAP